MSFLSQNNAPTHEQFFKKLKSSDPFDYRAVLALDKVKVHEAPYEMILDNPEDVVHGVNKVEIILDQLYFNTFKCLIIKHANEDDLEMVFNEMVSDANAVLSLFDQLINTLGQGYFDDQRSFNFHDETKVNDLACGRFKNPDDVIGHAWTFGNFGVSFSYRIEPLRQLVLSVDHKPKSKSDHHIRNKGTLIDILRYSIAEIIEKDAMENLPFIEEGRVKFVDYTFELSPPELNIFDRVRIRIFDKEKQIQSGQYHVTYFSRFEIDTAEIIKACDQMINIYSADSSGYKELLPYEIDMIDNGLFWTGRSWWINAQHGIKNFDTDESVMYWLYFTLDPDTDGFALHVTGFDQMANFHHANLN